jgi:hypothetical protein
MSLPTASAFTREPHYAALGRERNDRRDAQFHRLLDQPIHLVTARHTLSQGDSIRRLRFAFDEFIELDDRRPFADFNQTRAIFTAQAVEEMDSVARLQAQDVNMADDIVRQGHDFARDERTGNKETWHEVTRPDAVKRAGREVMGA